MYTATLTVYDTRGASDSASVVVGVGIAPEGLLGYDLYAEDLSLLYAPLVGKENIVVLKVSNIGNTESPEADVSFKIDGTDWANVRLDPLDPYSSTDIEIKWTPDNATTYIIEASVWPDELGEDLTNNNITATFTIVKPPEKKEVTCDEFSNITLVMAVFIILSVVYLMQRKNL